MNLPHPCWHYGCFDLVNATIANMGLCVQRPCHVKQNTILLQTPVTSDSYDLSVPSSTVISEPRVIGCDIDVPFGSGCSAVSHSLNVSILTHLLKKKFL